MALRDTVFYHERRLRPSIRALLRDSKCAAGARETLALIGEPDDLELVVRPAPPPHPPLRFENRWAYGVVSALLEPRSESEWSFLRAAAQNQFGDRWADANWSQLSRHLPPIRGRVRNTPRGQGLRDAASLELTPMKSRRSRILLCGK
jgi:hypothetical protein